MWFREYRLLSRFGLWPILLPDRIARIVGRCFYATPNLRHGRSDEDVALKLKPNGCVANNHVWWYSSGELDDWETPFGIIGVPTPR